MTIRKAPRLWTPRIVIGKPRDHPTIALRDEEKEHQERHRATRMMKATKMTIQTAYPKRV